MPMFLPRWLCLPALVLARPMCDWIGCGKNAEHLQPAWCRELCDKECGNLVCKYGDGTKPCFGTCGTCPHTTSGKCTMRNFSQALLDLGNPIAATEAHEVWDKPGYFECLQDCCEDFDSTRILNGRTCGGLVASLTCNGDLNTVSSDHPVNTPVSAACPKTCGCCQVGNETVSYALQNRCNTKPGCDIITLCPAQAMLWNLARDGGMLETVERFLNRETESGGWPFNSTVFQPSMIDSTYVEALQAANWSFDAQGLPIDTAEEVEFFKYHKLDTPLALTAKTGNLAMFQMLTKFGPDPNKTDGDGLTPMLIASQRGVLKYIEVLIARKADLEANNTDGLTALWFATRNGNYDMMKTLLEAKARTELATIQSPLTYWGLNKIAAAPGTVHEVSRDLTRMQPLALAVYYHRPKHVKLLLDFHANPNVLDAAKTDFDFEGRFAWCDASCLNDTTGNHSR